LRGYEIMLILPPETEDAAVDGVLERVRAILADKGGELGAVDRWGRRRLAFEIERQAEGYYVVAQFTADPESLREIDRVLSLADDVLRFKVTVRAA
jgi:small subunit ribosomal protein S6